MSTVRLNRIAMGSKSAFVLSILLLSSSAASAQGRPGEWEHVSDAGKPDGQVHLSTLRYDCNPGPDGEVVIRHLPAWFAPFDLTVWNTRIWIGTDAGRPGEHYPQVDALAVVYASVPSGFRLGINVLDRYAAPNAKHDNDNPRNFVMRAGEHFAAGMWCKSVWNQPSHVQVLMTVEYTRVQP